MTRTNRVCGPSPSASAARRTPAAIETTSVRARNFPPQLGQHAGHLLRLDGQDEHVRLGDDLGVVGRGRPAGRLGEASAGVGLGIGGQQALGRNQPGVDEPPPQGRRHLPGADQSDPLRQHSRYATRRRPFPQGTGGKEG